MAGSDISLLDETSKCSCKGYNLTNYCPQYIDNSGPAEHAWIYDHPRIGAQKRL